MSYTALVRTWEEAGQDPRMAAKLEGFLERTNEFAEIKVDHVLLPINPLPDGTSFFSFLSVLGPIPGAAFDW